MEYRQIPDVNLEHGQIARRISSHNLCRIRTMCGDVDFDVLGAINHVVIGEDVSIRTHDHTRSQCALHPIVGAGPWRTRTTEELLEKRVFEERKLLRRAHASR